MTVHYLLMIIDNVFILSWIQHLCVFAWLTPTVVMIMIASNTNGVAVDNVTIVKIVVVIWVVIVFLVQSIVCSLLNEFIDDHLLLLFPQMLLVVGLLLLLLTELLLLWLFKFKRYLGKFRELLWLFLIENSGVIRF